MLKNQQCSKFPQLKWNQIMLTGLSYIYYWFFNINKIFILVKELRLKLGWNQGGIISWIHIL